MKIALISTPFLRTPPGIGGKVHYGGLEVIVADLGEALAQRGHDVTIFAADGSRVADCKIVEFGPPPLRADVNWGRTELRAFQVYQHQLRGFDIIHGHNWYAFEYAAKRDNKKLKVCHTHHGGRGQSLMRWKHSFPRFNLNVIAISKWMQHLYKMTGIKARVVYNGVNLAKYPFKPNKGDRLIFIGRIDVIKQPHTAIHIAKKLTMGLDIIGGTWIRDQQYVAKIKRMCDGKQIKFHENAPHDVKLNLLQNAKALLFPSKWGEPFGLVPIEAMACGTPAIVLRDGATPEVVQEGGFVCNDVDDMIHAITGLDAITPEACRRNAEKFSCERMVNNYLQAYAHILQGDEW